MPWMAEGMKMLEAERPVESHTPAVLAICVSIAVEQRKVGDMRAMAGLELLNQLIFAAAFRLFAQQHEYLLGQVHFGIEIIVHGAKPSTRPALQTAGWMGWGTGAFCA